MRRVTVLVDDYIEEPLASAVQNMPCLDTEIIPISKFLTQCGIVYDMASAKLFVADACVPHGIAESVIVNRLVDISPQTILRITKGTGLLSSFMVYYALAVVLRGLPNVIGQPGMFCGTGHALPLHLQYKAVRENVRQDLLRVPRFRVKEGSSPVDLEPLDNLVIKSIWDLFDWKLHGRREAEPNSLAVWRPDGPTAVLYFVGSNVNGLWLSSGETSTKRAIDMAVPWIAELKRCFSAECGEVLIVDGVEGPCFLAFSHALAVSATHQAFEETVAKGLMARITEIMNALQSPLLWAV